MKNPFLFSTLLFLTLLFFFGILKFQDINNDPIKFIEVTGSAELEIEPDEMRFIIKIEEYWKKEFDKNNRFRVYKTKISIIEIEKNLLADLAKIGIQKENIIIQDVGNYWSSRGEEIFINKQFELILYDFKKIDEIIKTINTKGIDYMTIGELKNKEITEFRKQVKVEALKAAKSKAEYLLTGVEKEVGDIISIVETNSDNYYWRRPQSMTSNTIMATSDNSGIDNIKKIKLRYEIEAKFEIK